jgi:magnesium chelatase family protein
MLAKLFSSTLHGLEAKIIEVEVDTAPGLPSYNLVGLADTAIKESRERVRISLRNSRFKYPMQRISVNLAPAQLYKYGTQFDLSIALGILISSRQLQVSVGEKLFLGELSLDGKIRPVKGLLSMLVEAKRRGFKEVFVPEKNFNEAYLVKGLRIFAIASLEGAIDLLQGGKSAEFRKPNPPSAKLSQVDMKNIIGQPFAKRGLEISAAGGHNLLLVGPPGSGKTMLAESLVSILPPPNDDEFLEIAKIQSVAGIFKNENVRPFRSPHSGISTQAFIGGGRIPQPGEISLAHLGVLFLDEFPEFSRTVVESLRQPLETGTIKVNRLQGGQIFPAKFIFIAAHNPCPCGYFGEAQCTCTPGQVIKYRRKISGPILDRIDLQIKVKGISFGNASEEHESSSQVFTRIQIARKAQYERLKGRLNFEMTNQEIKEFCNVDSKGQSLIIEAERKLNFSMRVCLRILKVSRTIADLEGKENIECEHIAEALQYRAR